MSTPISKIEAIREIFKKELESRHDLAIQIPSEGTLLSKIAEYESEKWQSVPVMRAVDTFYARREAKTVLIQDVRAAFESHLSQEHAAKIFTVYEPHLQRVDLESLPLFIAFVKPKPAMDYLSSVVEAHEPVDASRFAKHSLTKVLSATKEQPKEVSRAFYAYERTEETFDALDSSSRFHVLDTFFSEIGSSKKRKEEEKTVDRMETLLHHSKPLKDPLAIKSKEDRGYFLKYALTKNGHRHIMQAIATYGSNPMQLVGLIDTVIQAQKMGNGSELEVALAYAPRVAKVIEKMKPEDTLAFLEAWAKSASQLEPSYFDKFLKQFAEHLVLIEKIKAENPHGIAPDQKEQIVGSETQLKTAFPTQMQHFDVFNEGMMNALSRA